MRTIWKFTLAGQREQSLDMPAGAIILTVREQAENICLWAVVDPKMPTEKRHFFIYGTGHEIEPQLGLYVGMAMLAGGGIVLHVFERLT